MNLQGSLNSDVESHAARIRRFHFTSRQILRKRTHPREPSPAAAAFLARSDGRGNVSARKSAKENERRGRSAYRFHADYGSHRDYFHCGSTSVHYVTQKPHAHFLPVR
ncbi:hypothetical protein MRX96_035024 [Rhipicephalus microplus]